MKSGKVRSLDSSEDMRFGPAEVYTAARWRANHNGESHLEDLDVALESQDVAPPASPRKRWTT